MCLWCVVLSCDAGHHLITDDKVEELCLHHSLFFKLLNLKSYHHHEKMYLGGKVLPSVSLSGAQHRSLKGNLGLDSWLFAVLTF